MGTLCKQHESYKLIPSAGTPLHAECVDYTLLHGSTACSMFENRVAFCRHALQIQGMIDMLESRPVCIETIVSASLNSFGAEDTSGLCTVHW